jgi:hypothetical protein
MPYVNIQSRNHFENLGIPVPINGGELQYLIAEMIHQMLTNQDHPVRYADLESVMGALAGAQQEFYREVVAVYEDYKLQENGSVYDAEEIFKESFKR